VPDLQFQVEEVAPTPNTATPQLTFKVRIANAVKDETVQSVALRCQVQIEPLRRRYTLEEQQRLVELFGEPERWSQTARPLLWANLSINVTSFSGSTVIDVVVPCTFDFNVAVTKYAYGLEDGEIPTSLLFSGTAFYAGRMGLQIMQIPWDREGGYRLPVRVWKQMMNTFYPGTAWISLRREVFDLLYEYKVQHGLATWEQAIERILGATAEVKS
jgi:uncharacterized protein DUF6084